MNTINTKALDIITCAIATIVGTGKYVSRYEEGETGNPATVDIVKAKMQEAVLKGIEFKVEEYSGPAQDIVAWITQEFEDYGSTNSYIMDAYHAIFSEEEIQNRQMGILISLPSSYEKAMMRARKFDLGTVNERYAGVPGETIETRVTIAFTKRIEGQYGVYTVVTAKDNDNRVIFWYDSKNIYAFTTGQEILLKGTIKALKKLNGHKQTQLAEKITAQALAIAAED